MKNYIKKQLLALAAYAIICTGMSMTTAKAETTECTQIVSLPAVITVQGIYCFKNNLVTANTSGKAITINTNNVTIDMNGFKLGGASAGPNTQAIGIYAYERKNITIRNGSIRGFFRGIYLSGANGSGHLIEQIRTDGITFTGLFVQGDNNIIRNNHVINTGSGSVSSTAHGILVTSASNTLIADNMVSGVTESGTAYGIYTQDSSEIEIINNSIHGLKIATNRYGIYTSTGSEVALINNRIINPAGTGTLGIIDGNGSTNVACIDNITIGYNASTSGCNLLFGHKNL